MTRQNFKLLVMSGSPDALNTNASLRHYVGEGFRAAFPEATIAVSSYEDGVRSAQALQPDMTLVFGSIMLDGADFGPIAEVTKRHGRLLGFWLHDDPYEFDMNARIYGMADIVFTNDRASLDFYPPSVPVHHLPLAGSAATHLRPVVTRGGPDLFFCGHRFANRSRFFGDLAPHAKRLGAELCVVGSGWERDAIEGVTPMRLPNAALPDLYASALGVVNIGRDENIANRRFAIRPSTPGPRTFEAAFAGAAQIMLTAGLEILDYFEPDSEILLADDAGDCAEHWQRLLKDRDYSLLLGRNAQRRALAEHGYDARARRIADLVFG
ncbi:MAG: glycosyltransferase [Alphaproteobacteria bacterium]|nr:glycosyltransferase [Alphaproteobacteria bacterium]MBU0798763.1 glycosyltransferase [Alphaproteobacteria bacterium]MBU0886026.1 glycosyltransferase [Alphaproteobacteria bacterium]MBU1812015.1 glycosyltransferase [Alphaproteobacteria bacterium]MBU2089385.1 glycosyltransferase [Alphaproteobacteria bacterium]